MKKNLALLLLLFAFWLIDGPSVFAQGASNTLPNGFPQDATGAQFDATGTYLTITDSPKLSYYRKFSPSARFAITDNGAGGTYQLELVTVPVAYGGTGGTTPVAACDNLLGGLASTASGTIWYYNGTHVVALPKGSNGQVLTLTAGLPGWSAVGASINASAQFYVGTADASISNASVLTAGTGIATITYGAGSTTPLAVDTTVVATTSNTISLANKTLTSPAFAWNSGAGVTLKGSANDVVLKWADPGASAGAITIPSAAGSSASNVVLSQGTQTLAGTYTFSNAPKLSSNTITSSSGNTITFPNSADTVVNLGSTQTLSAKTLTNAAFNGAFLTLNQTTANYQVNFNNPGTAGTRNYYVTDVATNADFVMLNHSDAYTAGGIFYANGSTAKVTAAGTAGQVMTSNGSSAPTFQDNSAITIANGSHRLMQWQNTTNVTTTMKGAGTGDMNATISVGNGGIDYAKGGVHRRGIEIQTATTSGDNAYFSGGNNETACQYAPHVRGWAARYSSSPDNNGAISFGVVDAPATAMNVPSTGYTGGILYATAGANYKLYVVKNAGGTSTTDTGVAPTVGGFDDLEIWYDPTVNTWYGKVNGTQVDNGAAVSGLQTDNTILTPFIGIRNANAGSRAKLGVGKVTLDTY